MTKYNGHKNYNHWNVSLWLNNDEGLYNMMCECIKLTPNKEKAAEAILWTLQRQGITKTPDNVQYTKTSIRAAMVGM